MIIRASVTLLVVVFAIAAPFIVDILADRRHRVIIRGPLNVYHLATPQSLEPSNSVVATVSVQDRVRVRRIRYEKDYIAVRVQLDTGQQGYIFAGDDFRLAPAAW